MCGIISLEDLLNKACRKYNQTTNEINKQVKRDVLRGDWGDFDVGFSKPLAVSPGRCDWFQLFGLVCLGWIYVASSSAYLKGICVSLGQTFVKVVQDQHSSEQEEVNALDLWWGISRQSQAAGQDLAWDFFCMEGQRALWSKANRGSGSYCLDSCVFSLA